MPPQPRDRQVLFRRRSRAAALMALVTLVGTLGIRSQDLPAPPPTRTEIVKETIHGVEVVDPYRWLEDQQSPETRGWIAAENDYTHSVLNKLPGREQLTKRLTELMKIESIGVPTERANRLFFSKRRADQDLFVLYMRRGPGGEDVTLIDPHPMSPDHTTSVTLLDVTRDGTVMAYGVRQGGEDELAVKLLDVETRRELPDHLPRGRYFSLSLKPDHSGFYYSRLTPDGPRVYYHATGTAAGDSEIFGKGFGPEKILTEGLSDDGRFLVLHAFYGSSADKTEIYVQDLASGGPIIPVVKDLDARFFASPAGDRLYLQTNWKAPNGRVLEVKLDRPARESWREVIPEGPAVMESFSVAGGKLFANYLQDVKSRLEVFDSAGMHLADIRFPAIGTVTSIRGRWESPVAFFAFNSFHIPTTIYRYDVAGGRQDVWARLNVPVNSDKFEVRQVWYESKDKTRVPMFLLQARDTKPGAWPTLMQGYGGFNISLTPGFSPIAVLWAEQGGVFAQPNLRGGGEFGEEWHRAGMKEKKQNVFDDFIAAAEWLVHSGSTDPGRLAIMGRSNGGLLVGAALTQRPDLFRAVVCGFPLLDMVRYQNFFIARFWVSEFGSSEDPEQFKYIYAYSPYHHVKPGTKYPAILFMSGDSDTRVAPLHARKMAALLQSVMAPSRPELLLYDTKSGHTSAQPVSRQIDELDDELSFLFWQLGVIIDK